jgi:hypothetical protein
MSYYLWSLAAQAIRKHYHIHETATTTYGGRLLYAAVCAHLDYLALENKETYQ